MTEWTQYTPLSDRYTIHVKRNEERAEYWLSQGKPECAAGSLAKASKWRRKAREWDMFMNGPMPQSEERIFALEYVNAATKRMIDTVDDMLLGGLQ